MFCIVDENLCNVDEPKVFTVYPFGRMHQRDYPRKHGKPSDYRHTDKVLHGRLVTVLLKFFVCESGNGQTDILMDGRRTLPSAFSGCS